MKTRTARVEDAPAIAEAHILSWQAAYRSLLPGDMLAGLTDELPARTERWAAVIGSRPEDVIAAELHGAVVGFARVAKCRDEDHGLLHRVGEVQAIYLREEAWGVGLGGMLLAEAVDRLTLRGMTDACLWVLTGNIRAQRFYQANGWRADGTEQTGSMPGTSLHEIRYVRTL